MSILGCSKCHKTFSRSAGFNNKPDYSGTSENDRSVEEHRQLAELHKNALTISHKKDIEKDYGAKYTELLRLPYYDPIKRHLIDPMHNLLLGSAKNVFECWIEKGFLKEKYLEEIDQLIQEIPILSNVGRVAGSVLISFKSFKAEELKNWVLYFSLYCLKDFIPLNHFNMWQIFVTKCHKLLKPTISIQEIDDTHNLLVSFVELFGKEHVAPNMHIHLHLKNCLKEFGPAYGFWCFSFERYNGILGSSVPTTIVYLFS